jgi:hypothetical protein
MAIVDEAAKTLDLILTGGKKAAKGAKGAKKAASPLKGAKPGQELDLGGMKIPPPRQGPLAVDSTLGLPEDMQMPVSFNGKDVADFEPEDWGNFGRQYGVENLGPLSTEQWRKNLKTVKTASGRDVTIPGGDEPFTYYDLLHLKSQGINPNDLTPELHRSVHNRMVSAMGRGLLSNERITNQLLFGLISPNQPLTPNELALQRAMVKGPQDLKSWNEMVPYDYRTGIPEKPERDVMSREITRRLGLHAAERGGIGASGSANYTDLAEMTQKMRDRPDFYRFDPTDNTMGGMSDSEKWATFVTRVMNETRGLKAKTGSLGTVWQDPENAAISAIDRHMATLFRNDMFPDAQTQAAWEQNLIGKYNMERPDAKVSTIDELQAAPGGRGMFVDAALAYVNNLPSAKTRVKKTGEFNERIPEAIRETNWISGEPTDMEMIQGPYVRALEANQARASQDGQGLFSSQWMLWDRIRNRLEPHEVLFPGLEKLPRMNMDQMRRVRQEHSDAGYMAAEGGVKPIQNPSRAAYFSLAPLAGLGLLGMTPEEQNAMKPGPRKGKKPGA